MHSPYVVFYASITTPTTSCLGPARKRLLGGRFAQGVADYSREHESWDFTTSPPTMAEAEEVALTPYSLKGWAGQGAIAVINDAAEARAARRLGFPVVCVNGNVRNPGLPRVMPDYYAGGVMAAEHLLDRGSQRLAYFGLKGPWYSAERKRGFVDRAKQAKVPCEVFDMPPNTDLRASWRQRRHAVAAWLKTLQTADCNPGRPRLSGTGTHR